MKKWVHDWTWVLLAAFCVVGIFYPAIGTLALICMLAPSIVAVFKGRMWCGNVCPRGSFNDVILSKFSLKNKIPAFLKTKAFQITFLVVLMSAFAVQLYFAWGSAYRVGGVFVRMILITTLLTIVLGVFFQPRTWCVICPMGTLAQYVSKLRFSKNKAQHIRFADNACVGCRLCTKNCPMEISVHTFESAGEVLDERCLKCNVCVQKCPKQALLLR